MADDLVGTILKSTNRAEVGNRITFVGLRTRNPKVIFENGATSPLRKVHETDNVLSAVLVASGSGSIDAFVIDKRTGKFARASAGSFVETYAAAAVGICK